MTTVYYVGPEEDRVAFWRQQEAERQERYEWRRGSRFWQATEGMDPRPWLDQSWQRLRDDPAAWYREWEKPGRALWRRGAVARLLADDGFSYSRTAWWVELRRAIRPEPQPSAVAAATPVDVYTQETCRSWDCWDYIDNDAFGDPYADHAHPVRQTVPQVSGRPFTYLARRAGWVKIGSTSNLIQRFRSLRGAGGGVRHPDTMDRTDPLDLVATVDGLEWEKRLHERYAAHRDTGEWFAAGPVLDDLVELSREVPVSWWP